jgi:tRNA dimethylallyltransferase
MRSTLPQKQIIIVVTGPTASGKSELAVRLAKRFNGEIISADSRQIYKGLDTGSAKVRGRWLHCDEQQNARHTRGTIFAYKNIPHYCIDLIPPAHAFTAAEFKKCAEHSIRQITRKGKLPIIAGGTAFWIDALIYNLTLPEVPPNPSLRRRLEKKTAERLFAILKTLDPSRASSIDPHNPRRLIRAIEIAKALGYIRPLRRNRRYNALWISLSPPIRTLEMRFKKRARDMVPGALVREVKRLRTHRVSLRRIKEFGFEYRLTLAYIAKKITRAEYIERFISETRAYAKRQRAWWSKNPDVLTVSDMKKIDSIAHGFLNKNYPRTGLRAD